MKLTCYHLTESIHDNKTNKHVVVLFNTINSSQISVDEQTYEHLKNEKFELIPDHVFNSLKEYDFLTEKSESEEIQKIISENISTNKQSERLNIVIQPTAWCQLGCLYCGQEHSKNKKINILAVLNFINTKIDEHRPQELLISWFGAEPLTDMNNLRAISNQLKQLCFDKGITYTAKIVTNGLNLTKKNFESLIQECNCKYFEITLDGTESYHDKRRFTKYHGKTFDIIYKNILQITQSNDCSSESSAKISIRCNVDDENKDGVIPLIHKLHQDGLHKKISYFYVAPVHSWGNDAHLRLNSIEEFAKWECEILIELLRLGFNVPLFPARKKQLCLATSESGYLIDPQGDVFGCTEVSLVPSYEVDGVHPHKIGSILNSDHIPVKNNNAFINFYDAVSDGKFNCKECQILPICGGRCPKEWFEGRPACPTLKFNIRERIILNFMKSKGYLKSIDFFSYESTL